MSHRERHSSDDAPARDVTRLPPDSRSAHVSPPGTPSTAPSDASLWTDWYERASPTQQQEALHRALQQGVLYSHQLEAPAQGGGAPRSLLSRLLNGQARELQPLCPPVLNYHDDELDRRQREAVARAIATPDVCLIQGFPGTGKSRLLVEIIRQAVQRGDRVLFLASTSAALDSVLEHLGTHPAVCLLRCLAPDEHVTALPAAVARLTVPERLRAYEETTLPAARAAHEAASRAFHARLHEQSQWPRLEELTQRFEPLAERARDLTQQRENLAACVERLEPMSAAFRERWQVSQREHMEALERLDSHLAGVQAELETIRGKQAHLDSEWEAIRSLAEARQSGRFWSGSWWRALLRSGLRDQVSDLESRRAELQSSQQRLEQELAARRSERADLETQHAATGRRLQEEEIACRRAELDAELAAVGREQETLREQWRRICQGFRAETIPADISRQALSAAKTDWERLRQQDVQRVESTEQWLQTVEDGVRTLPEKLAHCANVMALTTTGLASDALCGSAPIFDLLIVEEAHQVTESEFAAAARRARRWVLIGEPQADGEAVAPSRKPIRPAVLRPSLFQRLWQNLHADPHRLPFAWMTREGRLVCRLQPFTSEQEQWLETEPVVDRPDIELRILSLPRQTPRIVEVLFPSCMGLAEAKQFLFEELDELAVQTFGHELRWTDTPEATVLELAADSATDTTAVSLGGGVQERLAHVPAANGVDWHTCALEFAHAAGWTRQQAEEWIAQRLGLRTTGRTVLLTVPYRLDPPLAGFLSDLLFAGACQPANTASPPLSTRLPVEFVAVPALGAVEARQHAEADRHGSVETSTSHGERSRSAVSVRVPRLRTVKGGAGLEVDLADERPLPQLPIDLRALLPRQGLVNYLEACALVKYLEGLVDDTEFRAACVQWRERRLWPCRQGCGSPADCACPRPDHHPTVAVMALYPAQVELLRHLIARTPALAHAPLTIEVGPPSAFAHRECLLALVSLTRSHTHRAVSYAEHPQVLAQALTRAASWLILFGDPGTLARRSQWHGPLDHLDDSAAQRESSMIGQLVQYLQGHGPHPQAFRVHEGTTV